MTDATDSTVRIESFSCPDPADIQVHMATGEVVVELLDTDVVTVAVSPLPHEPQGGFGERVGLVKQPGPDSVADALRKTTIHFTRKHLVVQTPRRRLRPVPMRVVVRARPGSKVHLTGSAAHYTVTGQAHTVRVSGSGNITVDRVDSLCKVRNDDGQLSIGACAGSLDARIGQGHIDIGRISGSGARLTTGSGTVTIGTVEADLSLTTGASQVAIADAAAGHLKVRTGPGGITIGVRSGVVARVEIGSRNGSARSELPVSDAPPAGSSDKAAPLVIDAVSTSGDILVSPAT